MIDIILTDCNLIFLGGWGLEIRGNGSGSTIPVALYSGLCFWTIWNYFSSTLFVWHSSSNWSGALGNPLPKSGCQSQPIVIEICLKLMICYSTSQSFYLGVTNAILCSLTLAPFHIHECSCNSFSYWFVW